METDLRAASPSRRVRTAVVGYGFAGQNIHAPLISAASGLELAAVVSSRPDDVHQDWPDIHVAPTLETLLDSTEIDLLVIATPNTSHAPLAHIALDAGKSVVIDKPFALDVAEAADLIRHAERAQRLLSVFHCCRWDSGYLGLQQAIPWLGDLYHLTLRKDRWRPVVRHRWREVPGPGSGIWFDLGSHLIDQTLHLLGWPDWIEADIACQRLGAQTDDYFHVTLGYGSLRVVLHSSMMTAFPGPVIEAHGSGGSFVKIGLDTQEPMLRAGKRPGDPDWGVDPVQASVVRIVDGSPGETARIDVPPGHYLGYYEGLARAIASGAPNPVPPQEALQVMRLLELGLKSARDGRRLDC